jgi:hypothetical protein
MSLLTAMTAVLLSFDAPAPAGQDPCGDAEARQLIAFAAYSDKTAYQVHVEPNVDLEIFRDGDGPVIIRDATSHATIYSLARSEFDGYVPLANGQLPESDGAVTKVAMEHGTLIVDPSTTLSRNGGWVFVCWKANSSTVERPSHHVEHYAGVELSDGGNDVIRRKDGSSIPLPQFRYQVELSAPKVSDDGKRVGWLVHLPNCCTSYPIPVLLVVFKDGRVERVTEDGPAISDWTFVDKGTAVSYWTGALHSTNYRSFYLRDIRTNRLLATYDYPDSYTSPDGEAKRAAAVAAAPSWVKAISTYAAD